MADQPVVHIGENSPEQVAFKLMQTIAWLEGYSIPTNNATRMGKSDDPSTKYPDRKWVLDTYKECIAKTHGR